MGLDFPSPGEIEVVLVDDDDDDDDDDEGTAPPEAPFSTPVPAVFVLPLFPAAIILEDEVEREPGGID